MRLRSFEVEAIKECLRNHFGGEAKVYLFGSRTQAAKKGGDIDLLIEIEPLPADWIEREQNFWLCLQKRLGEQKIDIVVSIDPNRPIEQAARRTGVVL